MRYRFTARSLCTPRPFRFVFVAGALLFALTAFLGGSSVAQPAQAQSPAPQQAASSTDGAAAVEWVVLAWNDLGMHCYNRDFQDLAVLPPYNTLWAQVIQVGDPPRVLTGTVTVSYSFPDNTDSAGKSNFWSYAQQLFGLSAPLPPNVGLTGKGLAGEMDAHGDHFRAEGIPLTEFRDGEATPYPYQVALVVARDKATGVELARTQTVAPVSTEMHCDTCHSDGGVEDIATGRVETNILTLHDKEHSEHYPPGHTLPLMQRRPVLCAECHSSNALGAPGQPEIPSLSRAMHAKHAGVESENPGVLAAAAPANLCYSCHPGPVTQCLRDVMSQRGMTCTDCHGSMEQVAQNVSPWLQEPRCDDCHTAAVYVQDQPLYRMSSGHGGVYCEGCHDSPHAIAPSTQPNDALKFVAWQGHAGTLDTCTVCHATQPTDAGPHGATASGPFHRLYLPSVHLK